MRLGVILVLTFLAKVTFAQQNFFNVPSSDITEKKKVFFQQQFNLEEDGLVSNTTFNTGTFKNCEVGFNILNLSFDNYTTFSKNNSIVPYNPIISINAQYKLYQNKSYSFSLGSQMGASKLDKTHVGTYSFANNVFYCNRTKIVFGLYYASNSFIGEGSRNYLSNKFLSQIGIQSGVEWRYSKSLTLQMDAITGDHYLAESVVGFCKTISKHWALSGGYQFPLFNNKVKQGIVIETTYLP